MSVCRLQFLTWTHSREVWLWCTLYWKWTRPLQFDFFVQC